MSNLPAPQESSSSEDIDNEWRKFIQGQQSAFDLLYKKLYKRLLLYCLSFVSDHYKAENVVAETFLKLLKYPHPERIESVEKFLFKTAKNYFIDESRKQNRRRKILQNKITNFSEGYFSDIENEMTLEALIAQLPQDEQKIWHLHQQGYQNQEIAGLMQKSVQTIANIKTNIKKSLLQAAQKERLKVAL